MNDALRVQTITIPTEQLSEFGAMLPCEYTFEVAPLLHDEPAPLHHEEADAEPCHCIIALRQPREFGPQSPIAGWHIMPVGFRVERLSAGDIMHAKLDQHVYERVISVMEMLSMGPFQT